ncbi:hypothetical protein [Heyndrickxia oleronia]|nr:hypothetical protein [Heyndrickxia oleronia]
MKRLVVIHYCAGVIGNEKTKCKKGGLDMAGLLNFGSLILGLIALTIPVVNFIQYKKQINKNRGVLSFISTSSCAVSLCFQILYCYYLVEIEDWSALMDITGAMAFVAMLLLIITIILNTINLIVFRDRTINDR